MNAKDRRNRILDVAIDLAEEGGFENVRQRDVADQAGVALGTLYKSFSSKEDLLSAALEREAHTLELKMEQKPAIGATSTERLKAVFKIVTRGMCRKPKYARAVLRAMASGEPEVASHVASYQDRMNRIIISSMRGMKPSEISKPSERESTVAAYLQRIWFASLVGWSAGLHGVNEVIDQVEMACDLLLEATKTWK
ncbi:MAG TPA: TetR/AcrR family transcriptional regulator [Polyangiaceae bacterium]|nr:TetR/AcrR family transcriptional regulator [Polyangiaceae bacterium]